MLGYYGVSLAQAIPESRMAFLASALENGYRDMPADKSSFGCNEFHMQMENGDWDTAGGVDYLLLLLPPGAILNNT